MKTLSLECAFTVLSSLHHNGGKKLGTTSLLRRAVYVQPDGAPEEVPVISGNSLRKKIIRISGMIQMLKALGYGVDDDGFMKAVGAVDEQDTWETVGEERVQAELNEDQERAVRRAGLTLPAFHFLLGGGALTKEGGDSLDWGSAERLRRLIPMIGVLGGAIAGVILPGKIKVGIAVPLVLETQHLLPQKFFPPSPQSIYGGYTQVEFYTRRDESKNPHHHKYLESPALKKLLGGEPKQPKLIGEAKGDKPAKKAPQQMLHHVETIAAGVQLYWELHIEECTAIEFEAVQIAMAEFEKAPFIGAKSGIGHGKIRIDKGVWMDKSSAVEIDVKTNVEGREVTEAITGQYQKHLLSSRDEIRACLARMR